MSKMITVNVTARIRIVATIKGHQMTNPEVFKFSYEKPEEIFGNMGRREKESLLNILSDTEVRSAFLAVFVERLRTDVKVRKQIGGTRWSVDVMDISRSVADDALQLDKRVYEPKTPNSPVRRRCNGRLFTGCKVEIPDGGIGGSGFCKKCYFDGIEAKYVEYKKLRDQGIASEEAGLKCGFKVTKPPKKETAEPIAA